MPTEGLYLYYLNDDNEAELYSCDKETATGHITTPTTIGGYPVVSIKDNTYSGCTGITSITISEGVRSVIESTFEDCINLTSISFPASVTEIGADIFLGCTNLTSVTIDNNNQNYSSDNKAIYNKDKTILYFLISGLADTSFTVPSSVIAIGDSAFFGVSNLIEVILPEGLQSIGEASFFGCTGITNIDIPEGVSEIKANAFAYSGLEEIVIPNSITSLQDLTFMFCANLTSIIIPENIVSVGAGAFYECSNLSTITFNSPTTDIFDELVEGEDYGALTIPSQTIIYGYNPSTAKDYADKYARTFVEVQNTYTFTNGSGIETDPYQVWTVDDLDGVRDYLDAHFIQMADIDLSEVENWEPIGYWNGNQNDYHSGWFSGVYDGNGFEINNISIIDGVVISGSIIVDEVTTEIIGPGFAIGLFGQIYNAEIKKVKLNNFLAAIEADPDSVAEVAIGGIASIASGTISECVVQGSISLSVTESQAENVVGSIFVGGITTGPEGNISNSYTLLDLSINSPIGCISYCAGVSTGLNTSNCYSVINNTSTNTIVLGIGNASDTCYYDSDLLTADPEYAEFDGIPKTTAELKQQATFANWDFTDVWGIDPAINDGYPYLRVFENVENPAYEFTYGAGSEVDPYQIWTADDLNGVRDYIDDTSVYFIQMTDIDSSGVELVSISEDNYNWNDYQITNITSGLYTFTIADNEATITAYDTSGSGDITIPNTLGGYPVVAIGANAFLLCADLTSITIPASVRNIGGTAFAGCTSLTSLIVNSSNTTYKSASDGAIYNSDYTTLIAYPCGLNTFTIPSTVTKLEQGSFAVGLISEIIIPTNVTSIGYACFAFCMSLTKITFMSPTTVIYDDTDTIPQLSTLTIYGLSPSTAKNHATKYTIAFVELYFSNLIRHYLTKIEWLNWAEDTILGDYTTDAIEGSLTIDSANDVRRTFNATMNNSASLYIPNGARTNMGVKVRIKKGIITSTGNLWWNRGIFVLSDPSAVHSGAEKTVSLNGVDKWALFDGSLGGKITDTTVIAIGTNVADAIRAVAEDVGETKFAFDICTAVTPYTITREVGDTVADLLKELALIPSWDLYYDVDGYLRFTPIIDPQQKQIVADLSVGGVYRKCYKSSEYNPEWSKIKNYWKIIGYSDPDTGIIYDGVAQDNNPDSPTNTDSPPNGIGKKADIITDTNLTTDSLCSQRAAYELRKNLTKIDRSSHSIIPLPFLNEGDCVQLEDANTGIDDYKYEIQSITEPFGLDLMKIECWRCSSVFEIVAYDDFQLGVGTWLQLESGSIDIYAFAGNNCLRKTTNDDPNGGYRLLDKTCTDFELVVYTRRDVEGTGYNSYSVVDSSGNGYGISLDYSLGILLIDSRTAWVRTPLDYDGNTFSLGEWYTLRLNKLSSNFIAEIYAGKTLDFSSPLATVSVYDTTTTSFDRVAVNGGNVFYSDDVTVRKLL